MVGFRDRYDVIVLGAGNAGLAAASAARATGRTVLVAESRDVGGTCPLRGCVPKKVLVAAAEALDQISRASTHHIRVQPPKLDWPALIEREQGFVRGVPEEFESSLERRGIAVIHGKARFLDRNRVQIANRTFEADRIVVATGSKPRSVPIAGFEHTLSSEDLLQLGRLPTSMVFVGAGVIALEFSHVFARAGVEVTVLEAAPAPLGHLDQDAVAALVEATREIGVQILTDVRVERIESETGHGDAELRVHFQHDSQARTLDTQIVVNGTGRVPNVSGLDLEAAGISVDGKRVDIDHALRSTSNPNVFFAGDVLTGVPQLSPVATYEGRIVGENLWAETGETLRSPGYQAIPSVVHTVPALASVGMTEQEADSAGLEFEVVVNDMRGWRSARTYGETAAWSKVLIAKGTRLILGAHLLGHGAGETVHTFALAIQHGLTAEDLAQTVYAYPTFHSDIKYLV